MVEADLHEFYGIDFREVAEQRSWRWLQVRVEGLLSRPPTVIPRMDGPPLMVQSTRIGLQLKPPE